MLVGEDFRFGSARAGNLATLRAAARTFSVEAMRTVAVEGERVSSTAVRQALGAGRLDHAAALLGRPFTIAGRVAHGAKLGRGLGFPTANVKLKGMPPVAGVFAVRVHGLDARSHDGVASVGVRPTVVAGGEPLLEVFILDYDRAIYGRRIVVEFLHKLRDEGAIPTLTHSRVRSAPTSRRRAPSRPDTPLLTSQREYRRHARRIENRLQGP